MPTFAQKQNQPQQKSSEALTRSNRLAPAASYEAQQILHLQHTIGNQAALRLLRGRADRVEAASDTEDGSTTEVRSETPTTNRFTYDFSRIPVHAPAPITIQPKLAVNTPGDIYEQEADHVAEQVMRMPEPKLQRACGGGCPTCQTEQPSHEPAHLQTKRVGSSDAGHTTAPPIVHEVLASSGQPLNASTRAFFEPRFGHDFSRVRVHSDPAAHQSAQEVNANAYTVGHNIVFGGGRFAPEIHEGRCLLAHELTHVVQQSGGEGIARQSTERPAKEGCAAIRILQRAPADDPTASGIPMGAGAVPQIAMGDVKSIYDYRKGIRHISEMEGRGKYNTNGNIGIALYDRKTGDVHLQVLGPSAGPGQPRKIIYEGPIGKVQIPAGRTPTQIGTDIEEPVRDLVRKATGQPFPKKSSFAQGPDLTTPKTVKAQTAPKTQPTPSGAPEPVKTTSPAAAVPPKSTKGAPKVDPAPPKVKPATSKAPTEGGQSEAGAGKKSAPSAKPSTKEPGPSKAASPKAVKPPNKAPKPSGSSTDPSGLTPEVKGKVGNLRAKGAKIIESIGTITRTVLLPINAAFELMGALEKVNQSLSKLSGSGWIFSEQVRLARNIRKATETLISEYRGQHETLEEMFGDAVELDIESQSGAGTDAFSDFCIDAYSRVSAQLDRSRKLRDAVNEINLNAKIGIDLIQVVMSNDKILVAMAISEEVPVIPKVTLEDLYRAYQDFDQIWEIVYSLDDQLKEHVELLENDFVVIDSNIMEHGWLL